jgi:hypothetical protein
MKASGQTHTPTVLIRCMRLSTHCTDVCWVLRRGGLDAVMNRKENLLLPGIELSCPALGLSVYWLCSPRSLRVYGVKCQDHRKECPYIKCYMLYHTYACTNTTESSVGIYIIQFFINQNIIIIMIIIIITSYQVA